MLRSIEKFVGEAIGILLLAFVLLLIFGCSSGSSGSKTAGGGGSSAASNAVTIQNFAFNPATIQINKGESVTWTNQDSTTHTVTGDGGISSSELSQGQSYTNTFDTAGTFNYHCSIHPTMTGQVVVK